MNPIKKCWQALTDDQLEICAVAFVGLATGLFIGVIVGVLAALWVL